MRRWLYIAALVGALPGALAAGAAPTCILNPARVDPMTLQVFREELAGILAASGMTAEFGACEAGSVRITLRGAPPETETAALGAARFKDGKVLPELEIYVDGIARLLDTRLAGVLGRAMARVAAHEMAHYLRQQGGHEAEGALRERLSVAHLLAADRRYFRLTPPVAR
jgi:hypothetical protein